MSQKEKTEMFQRKETAPPRRWTTSGPLPPEFSQQDLLHQSFVGHFGHMAEPT